jgi:hypothetical protein
MLAVASHGNLELQQFEIRSAFLNRYLDEELHLHVPVGADHLADGGQRVLRLRRARSGLRQASWACLSQKRLSQN